MPEDWKLDDSDRAYATERGLDPDRTAEDFCDYWHAKGGEGARKVSWPKTWRRWCREAADRLARKPQPRASPEPGELPRRDRPWAAIVGKYREGKPWFSQIYGAPPGEPESEVPDEFLTDNERSLKASKRRAA